MATMQWVCNLIIAFGHLLYGIVQLVPCYEDMKRLDVDANIYTLIMPD